MFIFVIVINKVIPYCHRNYACIYTAIFNALNLHFFIMPVRIMHKQDYNVILYLYYSKQDYNVILYLYYSWINV